MIQISVDEKACVSCTLCGDVCPTDVFDFPEEKAPPRVARAGECFGCLSCAEICPADAIAHDGMALAEAYYHDTYALRLASRLATGIPLQVNVPSDPARRKQALEDLGVRLLSVATVFDQVLGGGLPAVGTLAGRTLARHLPRYRPPRDFDDALAMAKEQLAPAWEFDASRNGDGTLKIEVGACFVREVCAREKLELGGPLCVLFYNYLAGYLGRLGKARLRLNNAVRGDITCSYGVTIHA